MRVSPYKWGNILVGVERKRQALMNGMLCIG